MIWFHGDIIVLFVIMYCSLCVLANDESLGLLVRLLEIVVDNNLVVRCLRALRKFHLDLGLVEPLEDIGLLVCSAAPEALLEDVHAGRREEQEPWAREGGVVCDLLDALGGGQFLY
jgi:hypothetical protein